MGDGRPSRGPRSRGRGPAQVKRAGRPVGGRGEASPDHHAEIARFPAIAGKTWSQPTLVGDTLLVRNGREMAAFRLATDQSD